MQKFTRSLTREIEIGSERVAVTLDADGVTVRPVGSRRPPHTVTWAGVLCAATGRSVPSAEQTAEAIKALKQGSEKQAGEKADEKASSEETPAAPPMHANATPTHAAAPSTPADTRRTHAAAPSMPATDHGRQEEQPALSGHDTAQDAGG